MSELVHKTEPEQSDSEQTKKPSLDFTINTVAVGLFLFLMMRVFAVSNWNWNTAFALSQELDFNSIIPIVAGTIMANYPIAAALAGLSLATSMLRLLIPRSARVEKYNVVDYMWFAASITVMLSLIVTFKNWWPLIGSVILAVIARILYGVFAQRDTMHWWSVMVRVSQVLSVLLLVLFAVNKNMWLPMEFVDTGEEHYEGYIINTDDHVYISMLIEDTREIEMISSDLITDRGEVPLQELHSSLLGYSNS